MRMDGDPHLTAWGSLDAEPIGGPRAIDLIPQQVVGGFFLMGTEEKGRITQQNRQGMPQGQGGPMPVLCQGDEPLLQTLRVLEGRLDKAREENGPLNTLHSAQNTLDYCTFEPPFETSPAPISPDPLSQEPDQNDKSVTQTPQEDHPSDYVLDVHQLLVPGPALTTDTDPLLADINLLPRGHLAPFDSPLSPDPLSQEPDQTDKSVTQTPQEDRPLDYVLDVHQLLVPEPSLTTDTDPLPTDTNLLAHWDSTQNSSSYCKFELPFEITPAALSPDPAGQEPESDASQTRTLPKDDLLDVHHLFVPEPSLPPDEDMSLTDTKALSPNTESLSHSPLAPSDSSLDSKWSHSSYCMFELPSETDPATPQRDQPGPALPTDPLHPDNDPLPHCPPESASQILVPHNGLFATETGQRSHSKPLSFDYLSPETDQTSSADIDLLPQYPLESASQILVPHEGLLDSLFVTEVLENDFTPPSFDYLSPETDQIPPTECLPRTDDHSLLPNAPVNQTHQSDTDPDVELPQSESNVDRNAVEFPQSSSRLDSNAAQLSHSKSNVEIDAVELPQFSSRFDLDATQLSQSKSDMDFNAIDLPQSSARLDSDAAQLPQSDSCLDLNVVQLPHSTHHVNFDSLSQSLLYSALLPQSESCLNSDVDEWPEAETCLNLGAGELPEADSCVLSSANDLDEADDFLNLEGDLPEAEACLSLNVSELPESDTYLSSNLSDLPEAESFVLDDVGELPEAESFLNPEVGELPEAEAGLNAGSELMEAEACSADFADYLSQPESSLHSDVDQLAQSDSNLDFDQLSLEESCLHPNTDQFSCPESFLNPECDPLTQSKPCVTSDQLPQMKSHLHFTAYTSAQPEPYVDHLTCNWTSGFEPLAQSDGILDQDKNKLPEVTACSPTNRNMLPQLEYCLHPNSGPLPAFHSCLDPESNHLAQSEPFLKPDADQIDLASQSESSLAPNEGPCLAPKILIQSDFSFPVQSERCLNSQSEQIADACFDNTKPLAHCDSNLSLKINQWPLSNSCSPPDPNHLPQSDCLTSPEPELCLDSDLSHSNSYLDFDTVQLSLVSRACESPDSESCIVIDHLPQSGLCLDLDTDPVLLSETFLAHETDQLICSVSESDSGLMSQSETSSSNDQTSSFSDFADEGMNGSDHLVACENPSTHNGDQLLVADTGLCEEDELYCLCETFLAMDIDQIFLTEAPDPDHVSVSVLTLDPEPPLPKTSKIDHLPLSGSVLASDLDQISVQEAPDPDSVSVSESVLTHDPEPTFPSAFTKTPNTVSLPVSNSALSIDTNQISVARVPDQILVSKSVLTNDPDPAVQSSLPKTPNNDPLLFSVSAIDTNQISLPESPDPDYVAVSESVLISDSDQNQLDLPKSLDTDLFPSSDSKLANDTDLSFLPQDALPFTVTDSTGHSGELHETCGDLKLDSCLNDDSDQDSPSESSHSIHEMPFVRLPLLSDADQVPPSEPFFAEQLPHCNSSVANTSNLPLLDSYLKYKFDNSLHNSLPFSRNHGQFIESSTAHLSDQLPQTESFHDLDLLHLSDCLLAPNLDDLNLSDLCLTSDIDHFHLDVTAVVPGNEMSLFDELLACDANQSLESIDPPTSDELSLFESCLSDNVGQSLLSRMSVLPHHQLPFSDCSAQFNNNIVKPCQSLISPDVCHPLSESSVGQLRQSESCLASDVDQLGSASCSSLVSAPHFAQITPGHTSFSNSIVEEFQIPWDWTSDLDHAEFAQAGLDCGSDVKLTRVDLECGTGSGLVCGSGDGFTGVSVECGSDSGFSGVGLDSGQNAEFTGDCGPDARLTGVDLDCGSGTGFTEDCGPDTSFTDVILNCGLDAGVTLDCGSRFEFTGVGLDNGPDAESTSDASIENCGLEARFTGVGLDCDSKFEFAGVGLDCVSDTEFAGVDSDCVSDHKFTGVNLDCSPNAEFPVVSLDCGPNAEFMGVDLDGGSDVLVNICPNDSTSQDHEIDDCLPLFCFDTPPESPIDPQETDPLSLSDDLLSLCDVFSQFHADDVTCPELVDGELCCALDSLSLQQADSEFRTDQVSIIEEMSHLRDPNLPHMPIACDQVGSNNRGDQTFSDGSDSNLNDDIDQSDSYYLDLLFDPKLNSCDVQSSLVDPCPQLHPDPSFGSIITTNEAGHLLCDITKPSQSGVYETQPTLPLESLYCGDHLPPVCHSDPSLNNTDLAQSNSYVATEMGSASQFLSETVDLPLIAGEDLLDDITETKNQDVLLANPQEGLPPDKSIQPEIDTLAPDEEVSPCDLKRPVLFRSGETDCSQVTARLSGSGEKVPSNDTAHSKPNIGFESPPSIQGGAVEQIEKLALSHTASPLENTQVLPCDSHHPADSQDSATAPFSFGDCDPFLGFALDNDSPCVGDELARLRAVFDALDRDKDGFVKMEDFVQFATVYGAEQVKYLTGYLDPAGLGVINFRDFYRGISEIQNEDLDMQLYDMGYPSEGEPACSVDFDDLAAFEVTEVTDSAYVGSESAYSECETFTDEDTGGLAAQEDPETEGDGAGSRGHTSASPEGLELSLCDISVVTVSGQEEQFEDFGEGAEPDLFNSHCEDEPDSFIQTSNSTQRLTSSGAPVSERQLLAPPPCSALGGLYCSQCHKHINRLEDLSTRLRYLEMDSPDKRTCSRKEARRLHNSGFLGEELVEEQQTHMAYEDTDLTDKVLYLEQRVSELERDAATTTEQQNRLRQENLQLLHRVHALEEQLKDQELQSDEVQSEETRKHRDELRKMERDRSYRLTSLKARLQELENENIDLRSQLPSFKATTQRLEEEKHKLLDQVEDLQCQLQDHQDQNRKLGGKLSKELHKQQTEKERCQEVIEELRRELEQMQLIRLEMEQKMGLGNSAALQEYNSRTREAELEQEVRRLKQEQRALKEQNEELNGQIINLSIQGAKNLFSTTFSDSLAAEISSVSRDELMEAIQKQEEINLRLQDYIDRIIVAIMETNPAILEVKFH